jgi:hypothetical protein
MAWSLKIVRIKHFTAKRCRCKGEIANTPPSFQSGQAENGRHHCGLEYFQKQQPRSLAIGVLPGPAQFRYVWSLRREDHHDAATVHLRLLFQLCDAIQVFDQTLDQLVAFVDVGVFAASENDRKDDLILLFQEFLRPVDLGHEIVIANFRAQAEFLVLTVVRMALMLPLLLLVLEFAVIHDTANGRLFLRRHFHKVESYIAGSLKCFTRVEDAEHGAVLSDDSDW